MSDQQLKLRSGDMPGDEEFIMLQRRVSDLDEKFHQHLIDEKEYREQFMTMMCANTDAIKANRDAVKEQTEATKGMIEAWQAMDGAIKVGTTAGRFIKWLSGFAIIGGMIAWLVQLFSHPPASGG